MDQPAPGDVRGDTRLDRGDVRTCSGTSLRLGMPHERAKSGLGTNQAGLGAAEVARAAAAGRLLRQHAEWRQNGVCERGQPRRGAARASACGSCGAPAWGSDLARSLGTRRRRGQFAETDPSGPGALHVPRRVQREPCDRPGRSSPHAPWTSHRAAQRPATRPLGRVNTQDSPTPWR